MSNKNERSGVIRTIISLLLILSLGIAAFMITAWESEAYKRLAEVRDECLNLRVGMNYLLMRVRQFGAADAMAVYDSDYGQLLVFREDIGGEMYETRIFLHEGKLMESFTSAEESFASGAAFRIADVDLFSVEILESAGLAKIELSVGGNNRSVNVRIGTDGDLFGR
jgi:hypothetical protein